MADSTPIRIALPKGRLLGQVVPLLEAAGLAPDGEGIRSRRLILPGPEGYCFLIIRAADVCTFVARGAADLGIVGRDLLLESDPDLHQPLDLGIGRCRLCVAVPEHGGDPLARPPGSVVRVATKYDRLAAGFFMQRGLQAEIIHLYGSMELAPLVGMADCIVDLVETGSTLRANGLVERATLFEISSRLVVNPVSAVLRRAEIEPVIDRLRRCVEQW
ncbi:MAG: ATP phosphoribosyltransferase [Zetaproteobacteria bacterium]|nr:MAG: ATP phosphoribosyltransferase [Zetaproteobacteria bacterium]